MSCFLLPLSFCSKFECIISRFWWQKPGKKCGIHWCEFAELCNLKENEGMGFRSLEKFSIALLAKKGHLKAKYYSNINFLNSGLSTYPSYAWKSIWAAKKLFLEGMC
ncbi:reverse transcriptase [Gossypium australe]|uniref:Reverse transcriptase n=1 Tax=Gossypium australe TaxID=47621 RepID=A0A5B6VWF5_9ROSI|nr:reverse transcriptase [Gossypium australe]